MARYLDQLVAMGKVEHIDSAIGMYKGVLEKSYVCLKDDYLKYIKDTEFLKEQETVLMSTPRGSAIVSSKNLNEVHQQGPLYSGKELPKNKGGWTYVNGVYYWM
jgi:hypothetical protein